MEASTKRGTTALVNFLINISLLYILYKGGGLNPTGQTVTRGVASSPQGSPRALASAGRRRGQSPTYRAVPVDGAGTASVEAVKVPFFINNFCSKADFLIKANSFQIYTFKGFVYIVHRSVDM
jgi:hypothetical protein